MIGKLIIIGIIIATIAILVPNIGKMFPSVPSLNKIEEKIDRATSDKYLNETKSAVKELSNKTLEKPLETSSSQIQSSVPTIYQLGPQYVNTNNYTGQVFAKDQNTCQISVPDLIQSVNGKQELVHIIPLQQCTSNIGDPVQVTTLEAKPDAPQVNPSTGLLITPYSTNGNPLLPQLPEFYKTVSLNTINQADKAMLNFDDTSGKTKSVIVTMKNNDKTFFTGTFYSSKFTTQIRDIPNTDYVIDMTINSAEYGILHGSAYSPANSQNSTITGILTK